MPFPIAGLYKVVLEFAWNAGAGGQEIQDTGFWVTAGPPAGTPAVTCNEIAQRVASSWSTNVSTAGYSPNVSGTRVKCYHIPGGPTAKADASGESSFPSPWQNNAGVTLPPENTLVCSLYSFAPGTFAPLKGRRRRGRMYLPTPFQGSVGNSGRATTSFQEQVLADMVDFFDGVQGALPSLEVVTPVVCSQMDQTTYPLKFVRVGNVIDTQRRRRNRLTEVYEVAPVSF